MSNVIVFKIDVSKIDKERLFKGAKGTYLDAALIATPNGQYGDFMIVQSVSKEEREAGVKGTILGNGKYAGKRADAPAPRASRPAPVKQENLDEDVPF